MTSAKRKKEKKQDFQKAKLKVGKQKAKAANLTDTSFKAKGLVLGRQSIASVQNQSDGGGVARFHHHVSLLRHRSDSQRQESLAYLTSAVASQPESEALPEPVATLLPKLQPLLLDGSASVRTQVLKLLKALPQAQIHSHAPQLMLYIRAGMTHLSAEIRLFTMDILDWVVAVAPEEAVAGAGTWTKTLRCFGGLLGWREQEKTRVNGWTATAKLSTSGRPGGEAKAVARYAVTLAAFLRAGLVPKAGRVVTPRPTGMPLYWQPQLGLPQRSNAFAHLNLYESTSTDKDDDDNQILQDRQDRQRVFADQFEAALQQSMGDMKREAGEQGRAAAVLRRVVEAGMGDYERGDEA